MRGGRETEPKNFCFFRARCIEFAHRFVYNVYNYQAVEVHVRLRHWSGGARLSQVLSVVSGKGGTGKTSICAGVACCLAQQGMRVLCMDLDVGLRNLDISLGMSTEPVLPFTSVMRGEYGLERAAAHPSITGLYLLTAPVTETAESLEQESDAFGALIAQASAVFDWILLDAPAGIGAGFRLATRYATQTMVVSGADPASLRDAARATDVLLYEHPIEARLAVNRISTKLFSRMQATVDDVMDGVGLPLIGIVPEDSSVTLAAAAGVPLVSFTARGASRACRNIAYRLCEKKTPLMRL